MACPVIACFLRFLCEGRNFFSGDLASISVLSENVNGVIIKVKDDNKKIIPIPYLYEDKNIFIEAMNTDIKAK